MHTKYYFISTLNCTLDIKTSISGHFFFQIDLNKISIRWKILLVQIQGQIDEQDTFLKSRHLQCFTISWCVTLA